MSSLFPFLLTYITVAYSIHMGWIVINVNKDCVSEQSTNFVLINNKKLFKLSFINNVLNIKNVPLYIPYTIAIYKMTNNALQLSLCNLDKYYATSKNSSNSDYSKTIDYTNPMITLNEPVLSTYYSVWQAFGASAWQNITHNMKILNDTSNNGIAPTIETVIRSNDNITLFDLVQKWNWTLNTTNPNIKPVNQLAIYLAFHQTPSEYGFYCIYENAENEYLLPDCPNITDVTTYHANLLSTAGIDFIVLDLTNGDETKQQNPYQYITQIRPTQVLYEKWNELNIKYGNNTTPKICVWNPCNGQQYEYYLDLYNKYPNMVYHYNNKLTYFIILDPPFPFNQTVYNLIEFNDGRNNIQIQPMETQRSQSLYDNGFWTYLTDCRVFYNKTNQMERTSAIWNANQCNIQMTSNESILGSQIALTFDYLNKSISLPFSSPTKLNGRTFQLVVLDILSKKPQNVLIPSFNEIQASLQPLDNNTWSSGLLKDEQRFIYFVDTYGSEMNRAYEPSIESGDYYYKLMASCLRVI
eukprot:50206_1